MCAMPWATWLLFTGVHARCILLRVQCPGPLGSCSPVYSPGAISCVCGVLGHSAPVHRCSHSACCVVCAVSSATWLLLTLDTLRVLCCVCGVLGHLAPVHRCALSVHCAPFAVSWATWLLFTGVLTWCVVLRVRCPALLGSCAPVFLLSVLCCVCDVLGHLAAVRRVHGRRVVLRVRFPEPVSSCSPVCSLGALCCVCGVLGQLAPVHWCSRSACCVRCAVSWATWLLFTVCTLGVLCCVCGVLATWLLITGVLPQCVALRVRCPGPLGCCSPCARAACCVACAVSWAF